MTCPVVSVLPSSLTVMVQLACNPLSVEAVSTAVPAFTPVTTTSVPLYPSCTEMASLSAFQLILPTSAPLGVMVRLIFWWLTHRQVDIGLCKDDARCLLRGGGNGDLASGGEFAVGRRNGHLRRACVDCRQLGRGSVSADADDALVAALPAQACLRSFRVQNGIEGRSLLRLQIQCRRAQRNALELQSISF